MPREGRSPAAPVHLQQGRFIHPLTAVGGILILIALTALVTYLAITVPPRLAAASGPPEVFRAAATRQAQLAQPPVSSEETSPAPTPAEIGAAPVPTPQPGSTPTLLVAVPSNRRTPTPGLTGSGPGLPDVEARYWISIPAIGLEAPVIAYAPRQREVEGVPVMRMLVPNTFAVGWDETSAEPGFAGNTIMAGHNNLFGAVFGDLDKLAPGDEIAVWSEYGVFSYFVSEVILLEEEGMPFEVRMQNAQWLNDTLDDRLTLITCWPRNTYTHRLIVVATR